MQGRRFQRAPFKVVRKDVEAAISFLISCATGFLQHWRGGANVNFANCDIRLVNSVEGGIM